MGGINQKGKGWVQKSDSNRSERAFEILQDHLGGGSSERKKTWCIRHEKKKQMREDRSGVNTIKEAGLLRRSGGRKAHGILSNSRRKRGKGGSD